MTKGLATLAALVKEHQYIFRIRLGKSSPVDVKPMRVCLVENERTIKVTARRYTQTQRNVLENTMILSKPWFFSKCPPLNGKPLR